MGKRQSSIRQPQLKIWISSLVLATTLPAQRPPAQPEDNTEAWHLQRLTGHWGETRDDLYADGIDFHLLQLGDLSTVAKGGLQEGSSAARWLWELGAELDGGRLLGLDGWSATAAMQLQRGKDGSLETGDLQVYSNIDGPNRTQVSALFVEYQTADGGLQFKAGKWDANDDFAVVDAGLFHLQSSFGFPPTIVGLPSYPDPAFGGAASIHSERLHFSIATFDGATQAGTTTGSHGVSTLLGSPSDLFYIAELTVGDGPESELPTRTRVGAFHHTGEFEDGMGGTSRGATGFYALAEAPLWQPAEHHRMEMEQGLSGFIQYGYTNPDVSEIEHYVGAGLLWTGFTRGRPEDAIGTGIAWAQLRDTANDGLRGGGEAAYELFYRLQLPHGIVVVPDIQWIDNPGASGDLPDALVFTLRVEVDF
jgi:porin